MQKVILFLLIVILTVSCIKPSSSGEIIQVDTILDGQFVVSLAFENDGTAWAGIIRDQYALVKINPDGSTEIFDHTNSILVDSSNIWDMEIDSEGNLWMLNEGLVSYDGDTFTRWDTINNGQLEILSYNQSLTIDENDNVWFVTRNPFIKCANLQLVCFDGEEFTVHEPTPLGCGVPYSVSDIEIDKMNNPWFAFRGNNQALVFMTYASGEWTAFDTSDIGYKPYYVRDIAFDSHNNLWFNDDFTFSSIAYHDQASLFAFNRVNRATPISSNGYISTVFVDPQDNVWTSGFIPNLAVYKRGKWTYLDNEQAIPMCRDIKMDANGDVWFATANGIRIFRYQEEE